MPLCHHGRQLVRVSQRRLQQRSHQLQRRMPRHLQAMSSLLHSRRRAGSKMVKHLLRPRPIEQHLEQRLRWRPLQRLVPQRQRVREVQGLARLILKQRRHRLYSHSRAMTLTRLRKHRACRQVRLVAACHLQSCLSLRQLHLRQLLSWLAHLCHRNSPILWQTRHNRQMRWCMMV